MNTEFVLLNQPINMAQSYLSFACTLPAGVRYAAIPIAASINGGQPTTTLHFLGNPIDEEKLACYKAYAAESSDSDDEDSSDDESSCDSVVAGTVAEFFGLKKTDAMFRKHYPDFDAHVQTVMDQVHCSRAVAETEVVRQGNAYDAILSLTE